MVPYGRVPGQVYQMVVPWYTVTMVWHAHGTCVPWYHVVHACTVPWYVRTLVHVYHNGIRVRTRVPGTTGIMVHDGYQATMVAGTVPFLVRQ